MRSFEGQRVACRKHSTESDPSCVGQIGSALQLLVGAADLGGGKCLVASPTTETFHISLDSLIIFVQKGDLSGAAQSLPVSVIGCNLKCVVLAQHNRTFRNKVWHHIYKLACLLGTAPSILTRSTKCSFEQYVAFLFLNLMILVRLVSSPMLS